MPLRDSHFNCVKRTSADTSDTPVCWRSSVSNFVRRASADTSDTSVPPRCSVFNCVRRASTDTSDTSVPLRDSHFNCVRRASTDTSDTSVKLRSSVSKFVRLASAETSRKPDILARFNSRTVNLSSGEKSDIALLLTYPSPLMYSSPRSTAFKLTACSSPVRDFIPRLRASSLTRLRMECVVTGSPEDILSDSRTAAAKFGGIETTLAGGSRAATSISKLFLDMWPRTSITESVTSSISGVNAVVTNSTVS